MDDKRKENFSSFKTFFVCLLLSRDVTGVVGVTITFVAQIVLGMTSQNWAVLLSCYVGDVIGCRCCCSWWWKKWQSFARVMPETKFKKRGRDFGCRNEEKKWRKGRSEKRKATANKFPIVKFSSTQTTSVTSKKSPNAYKSCQKMISLEKWKISTPLQKLLIMWAIWKKYLMQQALKSCPKCNKLPHLVTLHTTRRTTCSLISNYAVVPSLPKRVPL